MTDDAPALACIILAAGKGSRMKSDLPKVMHPLAGWPLIRHVVQTAESVAPAKVIPVIGEDMTEVEALVSPHETVIQYDRKGTGHAVLMAREKLADFVGNIFVLFGDCPLVRPETLNKAIDALNRDTKAGLVFVGMRPEDPTGYGRMIANEDGNLAYIVEHVDANEAERKVDLCWGGLMAGNAQDMFRWLDSVGADNAQGEYYLTALPQIAAKEGAVTKIIEAPEEEMRGVNTRVQLAALEQSLQERLRDQAMEDGVSMKDPSSVYLAMDTKLGVDVTIEPNVIFGPKVEVGDKVEIKAFSHLEGVRIGAAAIVGPFARLRPGTILEEKAKIGNFVETKNVIVGAGSKINHLSYVGDASLGENVNIGAGTITCNYDGFEKYKTNIGDNVFIGSDSTLIAPLTVHDGAFIAAGSAITEDVQADALALARGRQAMKEGWAEKFRQKKAGK